MTDSIAQDRIAGTATKANASCLYEYMPDAPALVVNRGTDRCYLGSGSEVSAGNGLPIEAGATVVWNRPGQLWMILDPAAASSSASLFTTTTLASWEQSPAAIAAAMVTSGLAASIGVQVAQQANQLGVPPTFFGAVAYDGFLTGPASVPIVIPFDFSGSASIAVYITGISSACLLQYDWVDSPSWINGRPYVTRQIQCSSAGSKVQFSSSVRSPTLQFTLSALNTVSPPRIRIYVSNHTIPSDSVSGDLSYSTGTLSNLPAGANLLPGNFQSKGGQHGFRALWNTAYDGTTKALLGYRAYFADGTFTTHWFCDATFGTIVGTSQTIAGVTVLPPGPLQMVFQARATSTAGMGIEIWSGSA